MYTTEMENSLAKNKEFLSQVGRQELENLMSEFDAYEVESHSILNDLFSEHDCLSFDDKWFTHFEFFDQIEKKSVTPNIETEKRAFKQGPFSFA